MKASTVTILELNGAHRKLTLSGPSLPMRGTTWGSETRLKTKFVNGNEEAVQHVLGPSESPTDFEGFWRTTQLFGSPATFVDESGTSQQISVASSLMEAFESIGRSGSLLRVTWMDDAGRSILREGRIGPISFPFDRFDDLKWKCTFQWVGRGAQAAKAVSFKNESTDSSVAAALTALNGLLYSITFSVSNAAIRSSDPTNDLSASNASLGALESLSPNFGLGSLVGGSIGVGVGVGFGFGASTGFGSATNAGFGFGIASSSAFGQNSGFMSGITASVQLAVGSLQSSIVATQAYGADSIELASEAAQIARASVDQLNATANLLGQVPPELLSSVPTPSAIATASGYVEQTAAAVQAAEKAALTLARAAKQKLSSSVASTDRIDRSSASDAVKVVRTTNDDTFSSISQAQYGTPDQGPVIARANGFPSFRIAPGGGRRLVIPILSSANSRTGS